MPVMFQGDLLGYTCFPFGFVYFFYYVLCNIDSFVKTNFRFICTTCDKQDFVWRNEACVDLVLPLNVLVILVNSV